MISVARYLTFHVLYLLWVAIPQKMKCTQNSFLSCVSYFHPVSRIGETCYNSENVILSSMAFAMGNRSSATLHSLPTFDDKFSIWHIAHYSGIQLASFCFLPTYHQHLSEKSGLTHINDPRLEYLSHQAICIPSGHRSIQGIPEYQMVVAYVSPSAVLSVLLFSLYRLWDKHSDIFVSYSFSYLFFSSSVPPSNFLSYNYTPSSLFSKYL